MIDYPAGWPCERTVLSFELYLLSTLPLGESLAIAELLVARAHERFDAGLRLKDEGTRRVLVDLLVRFSRWISRERAAAEAERELAAKASL